MNETPAVPHRALRIHPEDNVVVALTNLTKGDQIAVDGRTYTLVSNVPAKHKFATAGINPAKRSPCTASRWGRRSPRFVKAKSSPCRISSIRRQSFAARIRITRGPRRMFQRWQGKTFQGFRRSDGQVGTRNHWIVVPLVFCENQNVQVLREAFEKELGFAPR